MFPKLVVVSLILLLGTTGMTLAQNRSSQKPSQQKPNQQKPTPAPPKPASNTPKTIENSKFHYRITVPGNWEQQQKDDNVLSLTFPSPTNAPVGVQQGWFILMSAPPCHDGASLQEQVDADRKSINEQAKDVKFTKDESTTFAGEPAWLFVYDSTETGQLTTVVNGKSETRHISHKQRDMKLTLVHDKNFFIVSFTADVSVYDGRMPIVKRVIDSFKWTDTPTTQPAVN